MGVKYRVGVEAVDGLFPYVDWKYFWVVDCVHNYCFVRFIIFANSECDGDVVDKVKEIRGG